MAKQSGGGRGFREMEKDMKGDGLANMRVLLLHGPEKYLIHTYGERIRARFVNPVAELLDFSRFDGEEASVEDIIAACETFPMLSERRVVLVAGLPPEEQGGAAARMKALAAWIPNAPEGTLLILTTEKPGKRSPIALAAEKAGAVYEFGRLDRRDLRAFIRHRLKDDGRTADDEVLDEIITLSGYLERDSQADLLKVAGDLKRLAAFAASDRDAQVRLSHVAACMDTSPETDVFAMLDAVSAGRKGDAMELAMNITADATESGFRLLALLTGQFEMMLGYREMKGLGKSLAEIQSALGIRSAFRLKKAAGFAEKYPVARLMELLARLYRVELDIKTGLYGERLALTMFIAEM